MPATSTTRQSVPGVVPQRVGPGRGEAAARCLGRDGAVVLTGYEPDADSLVVAAATVLGDRLRQLFPQRLRRSHDGRPVPLHADGFDLVVEIAGVPHRRRDPDEDHVLVQCVRGAASGGESFVADAYRFVDECEAADPELWEFLTRTDVDLYGAWAGLRGLPAEPRVGRHVEYTRTGRRLVRRTDGAAPLHRDPQAEYVQAMLERLKSAVAETEQGLERFRLAEGEILVLDNYRCWHGRDAHTGERAVRILTLRTSDAR
ncbi:TauD/TfdA family dioxygenase [Streptomyces sp. NA04227]|uniref:TauD/TfdA family dioxygenase n=1 Tax=Streptomyces sp. NA04227 TaxID=2742136 RepID=UPI00158FE9AB|nr:TauD/TfdA family dioxygenase [Streptomyces sp. NA04227]QKW10451.1 TauD/TfdA family dioxygenase [Streptomyces sp. NA04227]